MTQLIKTQLESADSLLPQTIDLYLVCASFERRCLTFTEHLAPRRVKRAVLCENDSLAAITSEFSEALRNRLGNAVERVVFRRNDPLDIADKLQAAIGTSASARSILVDITTFTHEALLILIRFLQLRIAPNDQVLFAYTMASDYSIGAAGSEKWLSKGISEIRSVLGFPGEVLPSRRDHLIILTGFETERAAKLVDDFEPDVVSLGFVTTNVSEREHHVSSRAFQQFFLEKYASAQTFSFECFDPAVTRDAILGRARSVPGCNVVVSAMNTKISTLGAALAATEDERIQLCYAFANEYNYEGYSLPGEYCYVGDVTSLLGKSA